MTAPVPDPTTQEAEALLVREPEDPQTRPYPAVIRALMEQVETQARIIGSFDVEGPKHALAIAQARIESLEAERDIWRERALRFASYIVDSGWGEPSIAEPTPSEIAARVEQKRKEGLDR